MRYLDEEMYDAVDDYKEICKKAEELGVDKDQIGDFTIFYLLWRIEDCTGVISSKLEDSDNNGTLKDILDDLNEIDDDIVRASSSAEW